MTIRDAVGKKYYRLTILRLAYRDHYSYYECRCDCGTVKVLRLTHITSGQTKSCGCLLRDFNKTTGTHGHTRQHVLSPEYRCWRQMTSRCKYPEQDSFPHYGGRGIKVCDRWKRFENFLADMGNKPGPSYSIDRIDNDGDYEPSNCRWATPRQQINNRRNTVRISFNGETLPLVEWADRIGINVETLRQRLRASWPVEKIITTGLLKKGTSPCA